MRAGDTVNVYKKHIPDEDFEGEAVLVEHIKDDGIGLFELWKVKFKGSDEVVTRRINSVTNLVVSN